MITKIINGHGHVFRRKDGDVCRCGGAKICLVCADELAYAKQLASEKQIEKLKELGCKYPLDKLLEGVTLPPSI